MRRQYKVVHSSRVARFRLIYRPNHDKVPPVGSALGYG